MTLLNKIKHHLDDPNIKIISFDIFDTLLVRPVKNPSDIFKIIGYKCNIENFRQFRIIAEAKARLLRNKEDDDITFDDIYIQLSKLLNLDEKTTKLIKSIEFDVESKYLTPRKSVQKIYKEALKKGKEIIFVSDMYLPEYFIIELLNNNGFKHYKKLYLSSKEKLAKGTGRLFQKICSDFEQENVLPNQILHIGDNEHADIDVAKRYNLEVFYVPKTIKVMASLPQFNILFKTDHISLDTCFLIGFLANKLFDEPYIKYDENSFFNGKTENISKIVLAPFLICFSKWILEKIREDDVKNLCFIWRDGYLPHKIFNKLNEYYKYDVNIFKLYLTRAMRYYGEVLDLNGFLKTSFDIPIPKNMTIEDFLEKRMLLTAEDKKDAIQLFLNNGFDINQKFDYISKYIDIINICFDKTKKIALKENKMIDEYIRTKINLDDEFAIFDIGYRGSVSKYFFDNYNVKTKSYHLFSTPIVECNRGKKIKIESFHHLSFNERKNLPLVEFFEIIISSPKNSVKAVSKEKNKLVLIRDKNKENKAMKRDIKEIQNSIVSFSDEFIDLFNNDILDLSFDYSIFYEMLKECFHNIGCKDKKIFKNIKFYDSFFIGNKTYNQII